MDQNCTFCKLKINVGPLSKTKVLVFSRGYIKDIPEFTLLNSKFINILGLFLITTFNKAKQLYYYEKGGRAMFSLL